MFPGVLVCKVMQDFYCISNSTTPEARKLEFDNPLIPNPRNEGQPAQITLNSYSKSLEPAAQLVVLMVSKDL